ncbi:MAG TPA: hypothetical protein DD666_03280 [Advenella kashmirensis]|uniref:Integrase catalytic domain-containing protein n=1 Tax=Advenella kashmirensis TaxID=310575 RepID=A0A356LBQ5_9BURK|nr:hypothetical protein [Advenella kashmirensis]
MVEISVKIFKCDYAHLADQPDTLTVMSALKQWFEHYNESHPHSELQYLSPRCFWEQHQRLNNQYFRSCIAEPSSTLKFMNKIRLAFIEINCFV